MLPSVPGNLAASFARLLWTGNLLCTEQKDGLDSSLAGDINQLIDSPFSVFSLRFCKIDSAWLLLSKIYGFLFGPILREIRPE